MSGKLSRKIQDDALKIYNAIGCRHYARVDFRLNENDEYFFLEVNTLPGMTLNSLFPKAAANAGLKFSQLIFLEDLKGHVNYSLSGVKNGPKNKHYPRNAQ